jgi:hypothetical protein
VSAFFWGIKFWRQQFAIYFLLSQFLQRLVRFPSHFWVGKKFANLQFLGVPKENWEVSRWHFRHYFFGSPRKSLAVIRGILR